MITNTFHQNHSGPIRTDRIGKAFVAVLVDGILYRRCLVCESLFSREASREHAEVPCYSAMQTIEAHKKTEIIEKTPM
jgi:hypothetical protein